MMRVVARAKRIIEKIEELQRKFYKKEEIRTVLDMSWKILTFSFISFFLGILFFPRVEAGMIRVPSATPSTLPTMWIDTRSERIPFRKISTKRLENTPAEAYAMIYKGSSIVVYEDSVHGVFVQKISLWSGARIVPFFDFDHFDTDTGEPLFSKFSPKEKLTTLPTPPLSLINGQFFDPRKKFTPLSFGFKWRWTILTAGADNQKEFKNIFLYKNGKGARIVPYSWEELRDNDDDLALVNLSLSEPHEADDIIGRTYICIIPPNWGEYSDTLFTFSFSAATESGAENIVRSWRCQDQWTSKLDSSGSAVYGLHDHIYYGSARNGSPDYRKLPQIIGFYEE